MNRSASLHIYDFATTPYDGDARQAHQLIPFIQAKLGAAKLSYILNTKEYPDPKPEPLLVILESQHTQAMDNIAEQYQTRLDNYDLRLWPLYQRRVLTIQVDATLTAEEKAAAIEELQIPERPILPTLPQSQFTTSMEIQLSKSRETARRFDQSADEALQLIRTFLSTRILNKCASVLHDHQHTSRHKLLAIWHWLQLQRAFDPQIISEIKKDMNALPEITNFDEAVTTIGQLNQLQAELTTLKQPLSDLELIITHTNKYAPSDQFVNIQLKYLQATSIDVGELAPSFNSPILTVPTRHQEPSWAAYSLDVATYARAHKHVKRTTSVLSASSPAPTRDVPNTSSSYHRERSPSDHNSTHSRNSHRDRSRSRDRNSRSPRDRDSRSQSSSFRAHSRNRDARTYEKSSPAARSENRRSDTVPGPTPMSDEKLRRYREAKAKAYADVRAKFDLPPPKPYNANPDRRVNATTATPNPASPAPAEAAEFRALRATSGSPQPFSSDNSDSDEFEDFHD